MPETRHCQNCRTSFSIDASDFAFYEKMQVPPPTFCPMCRFERRLSYFNERVLYKRKCDLCGKNMISMYHADSPMPVYCPPCWWSDKWDGLEYGREYDPSRTFLEQFKDLLYSTPHISLSVDYPTLINSDYTNYLGHCKNCYLIHVADFCENVLYSNILANNKDSMDCTMLGESELCYENIDCGSCYKTYFSENCKDCHDSSFLMASTGCSNCFGSVNLKNKSHYFFNQPLSKEEYDKKLQELHLDSYSALEGMKKKVREFWKTKPHRYMRARHNANATGEYVFYSKNTLDCFQIRGLEDGRFCQILTLKPSKDAYDYTQWGNNVQHIYECACAGEGIDTAKFAVQTFSNCMDVEYSIWVLTSSHIFGSANLRNKEYCILNKQYTESQFDDLRNRIKKDMNVNPFRDKKGRVYTYGEFFPIEMSPFAYNESGAMDYFPLTEDEAVKLGYNWRDPVPSAHPTTVIARDLPDSINDVKDGILDEIIECGECKKAFRIVRPELELLRRFGFPLPRKCYNCRYVDRLGRIQKPFLHDRNCSKCGVSIRTSYAPDRPEIVYCEACYNNEVV